MGNRMGLSSHRGRRRRAVDGEQLLALGAAAVAKAGGEACAKAGRAKVDFHTQPRAAECGGSS